MVFVADSQFDRLRENVESFRNLGENLREYQYELGEMPCVIQYNKRDLPNAAPLDYLEYVLNRGDRRVPFFEAVATEGKGGLRHAEHGVPHGPRPRVRGGGKKGAS